MSHKTAKFEISVATSSGTAAAQKLTARAAFAPDSINEGSRTVDVVWSTGAKVLRNSWDGPFYEELSLAPGSVRLDRLNNGAPFLADHDGGALRSVMGVVESARVEGGKGIATVRFAKPEDDPEADQVFRKVKDGIIQNISVGYRIHKFEKVGTENDVPVYRATDWEPFEISAVPMGADDGAGFRSLITGVQKMSDETKAAAPTVDVEAVRAETLRVERERVSGIREAVRAAKLAESFGDALVNNGTSLDDARAAVIAELARKSDEVKTDPAIPVITVTEDSHDKFMRGATALLLVKGGTAGLMRKADPKFDTDPGEFRGYTLAELARECLERRGIRTRGMSKYDLIGKAFTHRAGGYASTSDFAVLLETAAHKTLLAAYETQADTWSRFCGTKTLNDFRDHTFYRSGSFGTLDAVNEHGEVKHKSIPDGSKVSVSLASKANIVGITRKTIINDDMGALSDILAKLGRGARLSVEADVYAMLAENGGLGPDLSDSNPFFDASRSNIGTGAAISVASLDADRVVMESQTDVSGNDYIQITPSVLLVPVSLAGTAKVLNSAQYDNDGGEFQKPNMVNGMFTDIVSSPRLSGTRRYLFANPATNPAFVVSFLEGQTQPTLETQDGWNIDGTEMKVSFDYGVDPFDPKCAVTNAGT